MEIDFLTLINKISAVLTKKNLRLSIAESCTGGYISHVITNLPGSSKFYDMSIICYSVHSKKSVLGIDSSILKKHGMISEEAAIAMSKSVRKLSKTDISLSVTGIAGPEKIEDKGVGLIYMAVATEDLIESKGIKLTGEREQIKKEASFEALSYLYQIITLWT